MSDELPPPPPGITLMSPQEFLDRKAAPAETPRTDEIMDLIDSALHPVNSSAIQRNVYAAKRRISQLERDLHAAGDGDTWRAAYHRANEALQKCQHDLALALDHIEKDDKEIERLHNEIAALRRKK